MIALSADTKNEAAFAIANGKLKDSSEAMYSGINRMIENAKKSSQEAKTTLQKGYMSALVTSIVSITICVVAFLFAAVVVQRKIISPIVKSKKEIDDIRNDIGEELSVIGKIYCNYDFEIDTKISKKSKAISLVEDGLRKLKGSEQGIKEGLAFLGNYIYRDKIFFKQKAINSFASNAKYVSRACLVIGALLEGLEKYQEEKKNEEIKKARKEVYENFNKIAKEIECEIEKNIISPLSKELDILIQEVENTIDKNNKTNDNCKLAIEQARNLKIKCDNLIQSIDI